MFSVCWLTDDPGFASTSAAISMAPSSQFSVRLVDFGNAIEKSRAWMYEDDFEVTRCPNELLSSAPFVECSTMLHWS